MQRQPVARPEWRLAYTCGHQLAFAAPRTSDDLPRLAAWLREQWGTCPRCPASSPRSS